MKINSLKVIFPLAVLILLWSVSSVKAQKFTCLPPNVQLTTVVEIKTPGKPETVERRLTALKAKCSKGVLRDGKRREIRFFELQGCWGNPPQGYQEILDKQKADLAELRKKYTVIELTCNPSGIELY